MGTRLNLGHRALEEELTLAIRILGGLALIFALSLPASAQTVSYAEAMRLFTRACGKDVERTCKGVSIGEARMLNCMKKNESKISDTCKTTLDATIQSLELRAAAQEAAFPLCEKDITRFCKEYDPGNGRILRCLLSNEKQVSAGCNQAITDAGWR